MWVTFYLFIGNVLPYSLLLLSCGTFIVFILHFSLFKNKVQNVNLYDNVYNFIKVSLLLLLVLSFLCFVIFMFLYYLTFINAMNYYIFDNYTILLSNNSNFNFFSLDYSIDFFGSILLFLAYFIGLFSVMVLDNRLFYKNIKYLFFINCFILVVYFYVFSNNVLLFFLFYELLLIPSFLIVYFVSPGRRAIQASLYFLIWTQIGSFLVLLVIAYIISTVGSANFDDIKTYDFSVNEGFYIYTLLFFGFGFKVPIWPFHYWLTKTHVEAPSGFSMYLSGFLVKSAIYGFYKMVLLFNNDINTTIFSIICILGVFDASLKMWGQTDLKKLVAYGTIQEMNLIFLMFCWGDTNAILGGILFSATHGVLSALMFYIVDCVYRRYGSRSVIEISGLLQVTPMLGITILIMCILYAGLPGTIKFTCEFYIFCGLFEVSTMLTLFLFFIANVFGLLGFCKCWFGIVFGTYCKNWETVPFDLTIKELVVLYICNIFLVFSSLFLNYFF